MNNKEILKNVLVTVGLLTISIVALVYFNSKLNEASSHRIVAIAPSATIHAYNPESSTYAGTHQSRSQSDITPAVSVTSPNTPAAVQAADYPNNLVIHASSNVNTSVSGSGNAGSSSGSRSHMVQQRQQMNLGALTAVSSRRVTSSNSSSSNNSNMSEPFQDGVAPPGTISRKDLPDDPEEPFPDEDAPIGSGLIVLSLCALGYTLKQKLALSRG